MNLSRLLVYIDASLPNAEHLEHFYISNTSHPIGCNTEEDRE